jgi:hypothetical protein
LEERDRRCRRRPQVRAHHGTSSLTDPPTAAVRPARTPVPAPSGPVPPLFSLLSRPGPRPARLSPRAAENVVVTGPNDPASPLRGLQLCRGGGRGGEGEGRGARRDSAPGERRGRALLAGTRRPGDPQGPLPSPSGRFLGQRVTFL